jgi:hypothetical protein
MPVFGDISENEFCHRTCNQEHQQSSDQYCFGSCGASTTIRGRNGHSCSMQTRITSRLSTWLLRCGRAEQEGWKTHRSTLQCHERVLQSCGTVNGGSTKNPASVNNAAHSYRAVGSRTAESFQQMPRCCVIESMQVRDRFLPARYAVANTGSPMRLLQRQLRDTKISP